MGSHLRPAGSGGHAIAKIHGRALPLRGDDIDTDRIMPARFLVGVSFDGLEKHVFEDDRKAAVRPHNRHPFDVAHYQGATILVVNSNFGCGSSREHAPQGLHRWGIEAVIGESFAEIFFGNSVMIGLPCVTVDRKSLDRLMAIADAQPQLTWVVDLASSRLTAGDQSLPVTMPEAARSALQSGNWDATALLLDRYEEVERTAARLPYVAGWASPPS